MEVKGTNLDKKIININPCSIETIDRALMKWIDEDMDLYCTTNEGWKKVPCLWSTAERARQSKGAREARDEAGQLILPVLTVERTAVVKDPARKGPYWANVPPHDDRGGVLVVARRINQDKTKNFQNAKSLRDRGQVNFKTQKKNNKVVYEYMSIPQPVYVDVTYKISVWTEYQQQMNEVVQPFITEGNGINYEVIEFDGHKFEIFIGQDFSQENNVADMGEDERKYQTNIEIKVLGMLIGDGPNQDHPKVVITENAVEVKIPRERVMTDEKPGEWDKSKFRG
tara:strand:+ start:293 stop:1141 length:849 start_codon:yes stop_codon:yes gene_type:complete